MITANAIQSVINSGGPRMVYQAVLDLQTRIVVGYEALSRFPDPSLTTTLIESGGWRHDYSHAGSGPAPWFAAAGLFNLQVELELSALAAAVRPWRRLPRGTHVAVNISPNTILDGRIPDHLGDCPWQRVLLELTEHAQVENYEDLRQACDRLRLHGAPTSVQVTCSEEAIKHGAKLAIDDAGTGYASFTHVRELEPDYVKLDLSLVRDIHLPTRRAENQRIVARHIAGAAHDMGAGVTAEGIESIDELICLQDFADYGQGYYLAMPAPLPRSRYGSFLRDALRLPLRRHRSRRSPPV